LRLRTHPRLNGRDLASPEFVGAYPPRTPINRITRARRRSGTRFLGEGGREGPGCRGGGNRPDPPSSSLEASREGGLRASKAESATPGPRSAVADAKTEPPPGEDGSVNRANGTSDRAGSTHRLAPPMPWVPCGFPPQQTRRAAPVARVTRRGFDHGSYGNNRFEHPDLENLVSVAGLSCHVIHGTEVG